MKKYNYPKGGGSLNQNLSIADPKLGENLIKWQVKADRKRAEFVRHCLHKIFRIYERFPETLTMGRIEFDRWVEEHID